MQYRRPIRDDDHRLVGSMVAGEALVPVQHTQGAWAGQTVVDVHGEQARRALVRDGWQEAQEEPQAVPAEPSLDERCEALLAHPVAAVEAGLSRPWVTRAALERLVVLEGTGRNRVAVRKLLAARLAAASGDAPPDAQVR